MEMVAAAAVEDHMEVEVEEEEEEEEGNVVGMKTLMEITICLVVESLVCHREMWWPPLRPPLVVGLNELVMRKEKKTVVVRATVRTALMQL